MVTQEEQERRQKAARERREVAKANKAAGGALVKPRKFISGIEGQVSEEQFEREKKLAGTARDPAIARIAEREQEAKLQKVREAFSTPEIQEQVIPQVQELPPLQEGQRLITERELSLGLDQDDINRGLTEESVGFASPVNPADVLALTPLGAGIGLGAGVAGKAVPTLFNVGGKTMAPQAAVRAGNSIKNSGIIKSALNIFKKNKVLLTLGAGVFGANKISDFLSKTKEQTSALTTLGEVTSSIVGDSRTGAGDVDKGLVELKFIEQQILDLEQDIKGGMIKSFVLSSSGDMLVLNADIQSQLATVAEGVSDLNEFKLEGIFPDMTPQELQEQTRLLEEAGILEPVDLTTSRR